MNILQKTRNLSSTLYITTLLAVLFGCSFLNAGYTFLSVSAFGLSSMFLFLFWILTPDKNFNFIRKYFLFYLCLLIFVLFFLAGHLIQPYGNFGYNDLILVLTGFFVFFTSSTIKWSKQLLRRTFIALSIITTLLCLYGIYRYIYFPFERFSSILYLSSQPFIAFPNAFAHYLLLIIPLQTLYLFHQSEVKHFTLKKIYIYLSSVIIYTSFFLTYSRGAIVALFALAGIFIVLQFIFAVHKKNYFSGKSIQKLIVAIFISVIALSIINSAREAKFQTTTFEEKLTFQADEGTSSLDERLAFYKGSLNIIKDYPLFGIGTNNFIYFYPKYQDDLLAVSNHPHNAFLKFSVENGLPTLIAGILSIIFMIFYFIKNASNIEQKYYAGMLKYTLIGIVIHNSIDYNMNFVLTIGLFALFAGFLITRLPEYEINKNKEKIYEKPSKLLSFSTYLTGFMIFSLLFTTSAHEAYGNQYFKKGRELLVNNIPKTIDQSEEEDIKNNLKQAENKLNEALNKRWFKRDFQIMITNIYRYLYEHDLLSQEEIANWIEEGKKATETHPENPSSWNSHGIALLADNQYEEALNQFNKALEIDSKNYLEFHYHRFYTLIYQNNFVIDDQIAVEAENTYILLQSYKEKLANNTHITVITDNPKYGAKLYELFIEILNKSDSIKGIPPSGELELQFEEYKEIWEAEKEKMTQKYGVNFGE